MELEKLCKDSLDTLVSNGTLKKIVDEQMQKTLESILNEVFGPWSSFHRDLKEKMEKSIKVNLKEMNLKEYNSFIEEQVYSILKEKADLRTNQQLDDTIKDILSVDKESITLTELIKEILDEEYEYTDIEDIEYEYASLHIKSNYSDSKIIYIDVREDIDPVNCKYRITIDKDGFVEKVKFPSYNEQNTITLGYGIERLLRKLYMSKIKIELDQGEDDEYYDLNIKEVVFNDYDD